MAQRGGIRNGAGRKRGSSVYGESTKALRIPKSLLSLVEQLLERKKYLICQGIAVSFCLLTPLRLVLYLCMRLA
jgi:hypothetical protein